MHKMKIKYEQGDIQNVWSVLEYLILAQPIERI